MQHLAYVINSSTSGRHDFCHGGYLDNTVLAQPDACMTFAMLSQSPLQISRWDQERDQEASHGASYVA
jgi:hypothetical protein